jgi:hypothetical protein
MSWIRAIGGFFSGSGGKVVDKAFHTRQERSQEDTSYTSEAQRQQGSGGGKSGFDVFVDCVSRLIRPGITIWIFGGISGGWKLPNMADVDPFWQQATWIVLTFWFGGRAIAKDIPKLLLAIAKLRK